MESVNGELIMRGCDLGDPRRLYSVNDLIDLVQHIGFLPLFSNVIPGFSVEERVLPSVWWTGDEASDPWEWRKILAAHPDIAYGKFMGRAAGFISHSFFPVFVNYRRDGYDFDSLFEDELASYRAKKVMDVFELDEEARGKELMSFQIKGLAGFGKNGEKNFEGTITELQMQTYLIICDFRQKKNRKGVSYGWHIAVLETPETKWGREFVTQDYKEDPLASWDKIFNTTRRFFPEADEAAIRKVLGIKWPDRSQ